MTWMRELALLRRELIDRVDQKIAQLFLWTYSAKSSAMGDADEVQTADGESSQRPVRRVEPWGHRGRHPSKVRTLSLRLGSSNVLFIGIAPTKGYGPSDLEEGETAVYSAAVEKGMYLDKDGKNHIRSKAGQDTIVNDGSKQVARVDDTAKAGSLMANWMNQVELAINGISPGAVTPSSSTFVNIKIAVINSGAANFKA